MRKDTIKLFLEYYICLIYLELMFRIFGISTFSYKNLYSFIYLMFITFVLMFINRLFYKKGSLVNKIVVFFICLYFSLEIVFKKIFNVYFSIKSVGMAGNLNSFYKEMFNYIYHNIFYIFIMFIPFIIICFISKYMKYNKINKRNMVLYLIFILNSYNIYCLSVMLNSSLNNLYYNVDNSSLYKEYVGVIPSTLLDIKRSMFGFKDKVVSVNKNVNIKTKYDKNVIDVDFDKLISEETDKTLLRMHNYFKEENGTYKNKYSEYFKDKNLILFMAESFNSIAVNEELTPTLYELVNNGFVFNNFYSPLVLSTIGGEYQELTGLYPNIEMLSKVWRNGKNSYEWGIGNRFKDMDYNTYAYHDNQYDFQNRNQYLKSIGLDNYLGCGNGLETRIDCTVWPQSDVDMINSTVDDYINDDKFFVYYATVSGHMDYNYGNYIANKNKSFVEEMDYSLESKAYLATQIELDRALLNLIKRLKKSGKLDDTVIALVGDHYPYALDMDNINEISDYERDDLFLVNKSNFILWNSKMDKVKIDKVGSQIDVLPTLYNLFGVKYDSRLIIGKDILSDDEGLSIFNNMSWISDKGKYNSVTGIFAGDADLDYINNMNSIVANRVSMSKYLIKYNYYDLVTKKAEE